MPPVYPTYKYTIQCKCCLSEFGTDDEAESKEKDFMCTDCIYGKYT